MHGRIGGMHSLGVERQMLGVAHFLTWVEGYHFFGFGIRTTMHYGHMHTKVKSKFNFMSNRP
jgi:hypothetical protein